jgi:hypothetical protein
MRSAVRCGVVVVAVAAASLGTFIDEPAAHAAPRDPVKADALFREGQAALVAGDLVTACGKLADSWAIDPTLGTLLHLAFCHEKQGRLYAAWNEFARGAREAERTEQRERASFAATRRDEIGQSLPRARLVLRAGERALALRVDGQPYEGNPEDETVVVPAGSHAIQIETVTHERRSKVVTFPEHAITLVRFDEDGATREPMTSSPEKPPEEPAQKDESGTRTLGFVIGAAGIVTLGVGTYFGVATFSKKDEAAKGCDAGGCDPDAKRAGDLAHTYAALSTVLVAAGVVCAGAGLLLVLTSPPPRPAPRAALFVGAGGVGLRGTF